MTDLHDNRVYRHTVSLGDFEMEIEYSDAVWDDIEWPQMALEISGANYHEQIRAVRKFLSWQDQAAAALQEDLERAETAVKAAQGELRDWLTEDLIERWQSSVYEDATRSIAVAVMLTPLIESLFHRLALLLEVPWPNRRTPNEIMKLVRFCSLSEIPTDFDLVLRALFAYRNKMFHWGFEWPIEEREGFGHLIRDSGWPSAWFDQAVDGHGPWVFYLTDEFVSHCLDAFERVIDAVREYIQAKGWIFDSEGCEQSHRRSKLLSLSPLRAILSEPESTEGMRWGWSDEV